MSVYIYMFVGMYVYNKKWSILSKGLGGMGLIGERERGESIM